MSTDTDKKFAIISECMRGDGQPEAAIRAFEALFSQLEHGSSGAISEKEIDPVTSLPALDDLIKPQGSALQRPLAQTVIIKLNGGLGTSMGLDGPKSLLPVKEDLTFLDIIAKQIIYLRRHYNAKIPLLLMNSFSTHHASLAKLADYAELPLAGLPLDFLQHRVPKLCKQSLTPIEWPANPELAWCPPGHGDLYAAIASSGTLTKLLERGYRYAFISNADNLGATLDTAILAYFAEEGLPFLMEVTPRTAADRKGGHLARRKSDGRLVLRESAQCPAQDVEAFQDITRHHFFNTNNLWVNLEVLAAMIEERGYVPLPLIRNEKSVDPCDLSTPKVYQLESAMGAAIETFSGAGAINVPRTRFAPVKQCVDLLSIWSDAYVLTEDLRISLHPSRRGQPPTLKLDENYYRMISDLKKRFPNGAPSLLECESLTIEGDISFGANVKLKGCIQLNSEKDGANIPAGSVLEG